MNVATNQFQRRAMRKSAGFTLIELMVAGSIAVVGLYATMSMSLAALRGNSEQRTSADAEEYAQHILATVQAESSMWVAEQPSQETPRYLINLPISPASGGEKNGTTGWLNVPGYAFGTDKRVGKLGADDQFYDPGVLLEIPADRGVRYCAHYRLTWVTVDLVRVDVRVSWPRPQVDADKYLACPVDMVNDLSNVGSVTLPTMVMRNVAVQ